MAGPTTLRHANATFSGVSGALRMISATASGMTWRTGITGDLTLSTPNSQLQLPSPTSQRRTPGVEAVVGIGSWRVEIEPRSVAPMRQCALRRRRGSSSVWLALTHGWSTSTGRPRAEPRTLPTLPATFRPPSASSPSATCTARSTTSSRSCARRRSSTTAIDGPDDARCSCRRATSSIAVRTRARRSICFAGWSATRSGRAGESCRCSAITSSCVSSPTGDTSARGRSTRSGPAIRRSSANRSWRR